MGDNTYELTTLFKWCAECQRDIFPGSYMYHVVLIITRGSQLTTEMLAVGITWWYTYQSYRIRKGIDIGKTISSLLFYNGEQAHVLSYFSLTSHKFSGSMYFLCVSGLTFTVLQLIPISRRFLAAMYIIDIILATRSVRPSTSDQGRINPYIYSMTL